MKRIVQASLCVALLLATQSCSKSGGRSAITELKTPAEKFSYAIGLEVGASLKGLPQTVDIDAFAQGAADAVSGKQTLLTPQEAQAVKQEVFSQAQQERSAKMKTSGDANAKAEQAFLAQNKTKKGVVTTTSGLQYEVIKEGTGKKPTPTDKVTVNYRGTLLDGKEFDSSYKRGQPAEFVVNQVIPGWSEALQLMKVGSKLKLYVPSKLAYGPSGAGGVIEPNSLLTFEVELVGIGESPKPVVKQ